jgi:hypothetical protein
MVNGSFYMVFVEGGESPKCAHQDIEGAEREAKRLSKLLNKKAWVLCTIKSIAPPAEFVIVDCRPDKEDDLPF